MAKSLFAIEQTGTFLRFSLLPCSRGNAAAYWQ